MTRFWFISSMLLFISLTTSYLQPQIDFCFLFLSLWLIIINIGVFYLPSRIFIDGVPRVKIPNTVVITIDDGPDPEITPELLALLKKYALPATFFVIGKDAKKHPHLIRKIIQEGHTIANHSFSHVPWMNFFLTKKWQKEIKKTEDACQGHLTNKWFRPPYALMSPHLANALIKEKYKLILINIRPLDFGNRRIDHLAQKILKKVDKGGTILIHGKLSKNDMSSKKTILLSQWELLFRQLKESTQVVTLKNYLVQYEKHKEKA